MTTAVMYQQWRSERRRDASASNHIVMSRGVDVAVNPLERVENG